MKLLVYFKKKQEDALFACCGLTQNLPAEYVGKTIVGHVYRLYIQNEEFINVAKCLPDAIRAVTENKRQTIDQFLQTIPPPKPKKTEEEKARATREWHYWKNEHKRQKAKTKTEIK